MAGDRDNRDNRDSELDDIWPELDPREFIIPATDVKGHSDRITVRLQPGYDRQLDIAITSKWFPYHSKGDAIRHAIHRHLKWLEGLRPLESFTSQIEMMNEVLRQHQFRQQFSDIMDRLGDEVSKCLTKGDDGMAVSLVAKMLAAVEKMPECDWKPLYRNEIRTKFGHVFKGRKAIDLWGTEIEKVE